MRRAVEAICREPWAITRDALELILAVAARETEGVEAIERDLGRPLVNAREVRVRDGVAVIPVSGPLFRYANLFTRVSRATSLEELATDLGEALAAPEVRGIVLDVDSPGGQMNGTEELAELVFRARAEKPIVAHISGVGQSGAYWIASAAEVVTIGATALAGSIGTVLTVTDARPADEKAGIRTLEIVSSQSPKKRLDPFSEEGRSEFQHIVDELADVFIDAVARNRGTTRERVLSDFGQGGSLVGAAAVRAGLADRVATLEDVIADLSRRDPARRSFAAAAAADVNTETMEGSMSTETKAPAADQQPAITWAEAQDRFAAEIAAERTAAATAERERILGILALPARGFEGLQRQCIEDPGCTRGEAALRILEAQNAREEAKRQATLDALEADEQEFEKPGPATAGDLDPQSDEAVASRILSVYRPQRAAR